MSNDIKVGYSSNGSQVILTCGTEAFERIWAAVLAETGPIECATSPVRVILFTQEAPASAPDRFTDRLTLFGCGVLGFAFTSVLAVGVQAIARWVGW